MTRTLMTGLLLAVIVGAMSLGGLVEMCRRLLHAIWNDEAADTVRKNRIGWWE